MGRAFARQLRLSYAPPPLTSQPEAVALLPRENALRLRVVPLALAGRLLRMAMADPLDSTTLDDLQFRTGRRVEPVVATESAIERGLMSAYGEEAIRSVLRRLGSDAADAETGDEADVLRQASEAPPIVALVNLFLDRAVAAGASDVHVEPGRDRLVVRARVEGVLREILEVPASAAAAVMAGLDIAVKRRPQDGRSAVTGGTSGSGCA